MVESFSLSFILDRDFTPLLPVHLPLTSVLTVTTSLVSVLQALSLALKVFQLSLFSKLIHFNFIFILCGLCI